MFRQLIAKAIFWAIEPELNRREREALTLVVKAMDDVGSLGGRGRRLPSSVSGLGGLARH